MNTTAVLSLPLFITQIYSLHLEKKFGLPTSENGDSIRFLWCLQKILLKLQKIHTLQKKARMGFAASYFFKSFFKPLLMQLHVIFFCLETQF